MKLERRSTVDDAPRWADPSSGEEDGGRCRKHPPSPFLPPYSVCPCCLRERLVRLCPDCASLRPCGCQPSTSASSCSSSFSSAAGSGRGTAGSSTAGGGCDKISSLIASEPAFGRSKSVGFPLMRSGSMAVELERSRSVATGAVAASCKRKKRWWKWAAIWPFRGSDEKGTAEKGKESKWWYFPSPIRVFAYRKSVSRGGIY